MRWRSANSRRRSSSPSGNNRNSATRERTRSLGLRHVELPEWYDVDDPSDLPRLGRDADADSHTARALARLAARDETGRGLRGTGNDPR